MNNKINLVNPLNPNEIIKTIELIEKNIEDNEPNKIDENINEINIENNKIDENINATDNQNNNEVKETKPNKLKKLLPIIIVLVVSIIGLIIFLLTRNNNEPIIAVNETLNNIVNKLNIDNSTITNNKLTVNEHEYILEETYNSDGSIKNSYITTEIYNNSELDMLLLIIDAIAQNNGVESNKTYEYLKSIDFNIENIEGIEITNNTYKIDTTKKFNKVSSYNYFTFDDLKVYKDYIIGTGKINIDKKDLSLYKLEDNDLYINIIIGQKNEINNLTYNTILSVVEVTYPDELTKFKENYTTLENKIYERYTITLDPVIDNNVINKDNYKYVQLTIQKEI